MNPHKENKRTSQQRRKSGTGITGIAIAIILIVAAAFLLSPYISKKLPDHKPVEISESKQSEPLIKQKDNQPEPAFSLRLQQDDKEKNVPKDPVDSPEKQEGQTEEQIALRACEQTTNSVLTFYNQLDQQAYIQDAELNSKSSQYFTKLIQKLLENPPVVTRETDDLFTILQNTAHFFRVIGKKNITIIKGILHNEKDRFEDVLANYYNFALTSDCPRKELSLQFPQGSLYDYAGFFLNTMGGRLYLFRRDSHSRMVIIYYAILIVDQSNENGTNRHGIQVKQSIDSLIEEIESVGSHLNLREHYLNKLYDLKEKYQ